MTEATMRRFAGTALTGIDAFAVETVSIPEPSPGEVRIRVDVTGLGFVDALIVAGRYQRHPPLPYVPGGEIAGTIDAVGAGVTNLVIGDAVVTWQLGGGAADFTVVPAAQVDVRPEGVSARDAAALLLDGMTAYYALLDRGALQAGETVLVMGAAGGVGAAAVQIASNHGAFVVAAVSSPAKAKAAYGLGAHAVVDYTDPDWRSALRAVLPGSGVDIVVDPVGGSTFEQAFRSLAKGGRHLVVGFAAGQIPHLSTNLPLLKSAALIGVDIRYLHESDATRAKAVRAALLASIASGNIRAQVAETFPLEQTAQAFAALLRRERVGKVILLAQTSDGLCQTKCTIR